MGQKKNVIEKPKAIDCGEDPDCEKCPNKCVSINKCEYCTCPLECPSYATVEDKITNIFRKTKAKQSGVSFFTARFR